LPDIDEAAWLMFDWASPNEAALTRLDGFERVTRIELA
jgi:hypothetical protein